jgi:hypothetical protein
VLNHKHYIRGSDGSLIEHGGGRDACPAPECEWPWIDAMVTAMGETEVTGVVKERTDVSVRLETSAGEWYWRPLDKVRPPDRGMYCRHGLKIIETVPAEHTCKQAQPSCDMPCEPGHRCPEDHGWCKACYPDYQKIRPWPCELPGCTEVDVDREEQEQIDAYHEEMRQAYYG